MKALVIDSTDYSLGIDFNPSSKSLKLWGESRPENAPAFFNPIIDWLKDYKSFLKDNPSSEKIKVDFEIEYFNSTSAKFILDIFLALKNIATEIPSIELDINWLYLEIDEDILECGEEFQDLSGLDLNLIPKK